MGVLQLVQIGGPADGTQHGLRARSATDSGQLTESGSHLYQVRLLPADADVREPDADKLAACCGIFHLPCDVLFAIWTRSSTYPA